MSAQSESLTDLHIYNPTCCPLGGQCGADHPVLGPANGQWFYVHGETTEVIGWNTLLPPASAMVYYWARTTTEESSGDTEYDKFYCFGDDTVEIGYNVNLEAYVWLQFFPIFEIEDPQ